MMMWPMSDVPVSAFWLAAILAGAAATTTARIIGCAALCGIAILIRPNLAPLAIVPAGLVLWPTLALGPREGFRRALWLAVGVAPFLATISVMNATLFGSPFESGYGSLAGLYRTNRIVTNGSRHVSWLAESQGPLVFAFVLGVAWQFGARGTASLRWGIAFCALLWIAYLPYHSFSDWWYLRFLLPAFPILFVLAVSGVAAAASWLGMTARTIVTALFVTAVAWHGVGFAHSKLVPSIGEGEQRYIEMGLYAATLPPDAVFLSVQHTGSIRYYSGRTTLRFDVLDPDWLDRTVEILEGMGRRPYVVLEQWEEGLFRERFRGQASLARLARGPIAVLDAPIGVTVYDFRADATAPADVHRIPHVPRWICCEPHW
jgi:hypothetical protein